VKRRKALKLTQKQVADAVGVTSRTVQSWELGENIPRLDPLQVWRLCQVLRVHPSYAMSNNAYPRMMARAVNLGVLTAH
jgi:transcriptional regulator with XRE-family HTH domain